MTSIIRLVFVLGVFSFLACSSGEQPEQQESASAESQPDKESAWITIHKNNARMLVEAAKPRNRDAVIDVPWTPAMRKQGIAQGFTAAEDAKATRGVYRFDCMDRKIALSSYSVLSTKGKELAAADFPEAKLLPVQRGSTSAHYLVAACEDLYKPDQIKRLLTKAAATKATGDTKSPGGAEPEAG